MKFLLDTADCDAVKRILPYFPIDGFTTNPTILSKETKDVKGTLTELARLSEGKRSVHAQVTAATADRMFEQAKALRALVGPNFYVKIPANREGLRAVSLCRAANIHVTVTAVFTAMQALVAARAGADYVAPYVNRIDSITGDGIAVVKDIVNLFQTYHLETQVLAASFKNVQQVLDVARVGSQTATISPDLCEALLFHPYTDKSVKDFASDWTKAFGDKQVDDLI